MKMNKFFTHFRSFSGHHSDGQGAYFYFLKSFNKPHRSAQQVAAATDKVFYHIFLTCKCFMVINVRWLRSLFYTTAQACGSSYTQN